MKVASNAAKLGLRCALFSAIAAALVYGDSETDAFHQIRSALFAVTKPLIEVAEVPADVQIALRYALHDRELIMERNRAVHEENVQLRRRVIQLENSEQHAKWLADLLNASEQLDDPVLLASLKSIDLGSIDQRVIVDRGTNDGAFVGQAVLDFRGILGQVSEITRTESAVTLITHSNHSIPVRVRRTGLLSIANGLGDTNQMAIPYVAGDPDIRVGDVFVTSGLGGRFPAGYPVAEVTSVEFDRNEPFAEIYAKPFATIDYGYDVLLVMKSDPRAPDQTPTLSMNETDSR